MNVHMDEKKNHVNYANHATCVQRQRCVCCTVAHHIVIIMYNTTCIFVYLFFLCNDMEIHYKQLYNIQYGWPEKSKMHFWL